MHASTPRQQDILGFSKGIHNPTRVTPGAETGKQCGFTRPRRVPGHRVAPRARFRIPLCGSIPAGLAETRTEEADGCVSVDIGNVVGLKPSPRLFALKVRGDSMVGKGILPGDIVVLQQGRNPRQGDVVAALIDGASTLKTFVTEQGKAYLKAENPRYPRLIPSQELVIQGVVLTVIRYLQP